MRRVIVLFSLITFNVTAQDPIFTNTQQSLVALNPSFAGSNGGLRYLSNTRLQWLASSGSYQTYYNSVDAYLKRIKGGMALSFSHDDQAKGTLVTNRIDFSYAQHIEFFEKKLKIIPSVQVGVFQKTLDRSKLNFGDQIDARRGFVYSQGPDITTGKTSRLNIDFCAGLIINYKRLYIGSTFYHITQPDEGLQGVSKLPYRVSAFASYNLFIGEKVIINGLFRYESQQNFSYTNLNLNFLFFNHLIASTGLLNDNAITSAVGYRHNYFSILGSYEFGISKISPSAASYEICASFNLRNKDNRKIVTDFERW